MSDFKIELRGMTLEEVCRAYPEQVATAIERHAREHSHPPVDCVIKKEEECPSPTEKEGKKCECRVCKRNHRYESILNKCNLSEDDRKFMDEVLTLLLNVETDLEFAECKLHGKWPGYEKFATA